MSACGSGRGQASGWDTTVIGTLTASRSRLGTSSPSQRDRPFGQRRDDDLVDRLLAHRVADGLHRIWVTDLAVGLAPQVAQASQELIEPGLGGRMRGLLVAVSRLPTRSRGTTT